MRGVTRNAPVARAGWRARVLATGLASVTLVGVLGAPAAAALPADGNGNYTQILCGDPATGDGVAITGMPEGLTNPASTTTWQITTSQVDCGAGAISAVRGVPMAVGQGNTYAQGSWSALLYQAPTNVTINGAAVYRAEQAGGTNNGFMGINQQGGDYTNLYSLPRNNVDQGDWFAGNIAARGTFASPFSPANVVNVTVSPDGGHWAVNATCDPNGNNNSSCTLAAGQWEYRIFGGTVSLHAGNDPQASNITGPMTTDTPLRSTEPVTFSATDAGPGLAYMKLVVDGDTIQTETIDTNNGRCVPVAGHDAYTWAYQVPCKTSVGGHTYTLDTAAISDGTHHLQVVIEDAAGNQSVVLDRTTATHNAPVDSTPPTILAANPLEVGSRLAAQTGAWAAPSGAGVITYGYEWQDCDPAGQSCENIPAATSASYTARTQDVGRTVRVLVTAADQDGLTSIASSPSSPVAPGPGVLLATLGPANGFGASTTATLTLNSPHTFTRAFSARAVTLTGRLRNAAGQPVAGASVQLSQQVAGTPATAAGSALTRADGSFTVHAPPGPSRTLQVSYRGYTGQSGYAAAASVREEVTAGVILHVTPTRTTAQGTITLTGRVAGTIPPIGVVVELLVHYRGQWEPFRTPRTDRHGRFHVSYRFQGATGEFPFRAAVIASQAGFPYADGRSSAVQVDAR